MTLIGCNTKQKQLEIEVYETSASGNKLTQLTEFTSTDNAVSMKLIPEEKFQTITGFGGACTGLVVPRYRRSLHRLRH